MIDACRERGNFPGDPQAIRCFVVSFGCTSSIQTAVKWKASADEKAGIPRAQLVPSGRPGILSPDLDGVFVLGKGYMYYDNVSLGHATVESRKTNPESRWVAVDCSSGALPQLFVTLIALSQRPTTHFLNLHSYLENRDCDMTVSYSP